MNSITFEVQRYPCIPNPCSRKARAAKSTILALGGSFYRFSINGCSNVADFEIYLQEKFGLGEGVILNAIEAMSEVCDAVLGVRVKKVWGIAEIIDGFETISFTGFAFTEMELENKTKLFLAGVQKLKGCLEAALSSGSSAMVGISTWKI